MPPAVQTRVPAPQAPAAPKRSSAAAAAEPQSTAKSAATDFRAELVRQRKDKAKPRDAAETARAAAKPKSPQKPRRGRSSHTKQDAERATDGPAEAMSTAPNAAAVDPSERGDETAALSAPAAVEGNTQVDAAPPEESTEASAAVTAVTTDPSHVAAEPQPAADGDETPTVERSVASKLIAIEAQTGGGSADAQPEVADEAAATRDETTEELPELETTRGGARPQRSASQLGEAVAANSKSRAAEGEVGDREDRDGTAGDPSWMRELDAALGVQSDAVPQEEQSATATASHAVRAGSIDPSTAPSIDLSIKHIGPVGGHAAATGAARLEDATPPELRFAADNHENIVKGMRAEVLPNGGSMRIRLDPPQLGALQVTVQIRDGMVTAAFETSNDEATRLLGHSLNQLKAVLESHGVGVEKLQVQQAPRDERSGSARDEQNHNRDQNPHEQEHAARQEQQRREMLRRMWRRLAGGGDPLDVTV